MVNSRTQFAGQIQQTGKQPQDVRLNVEELFTRGTYTPAFTGATTDPVLGNGTLTGNFERTGKRVITSIVLTIGSTTTLGSGQWFFALPFDPSSVDIRWLGLAYIVDSNASTRYIGLSRVVPNTSTVSVHFDNTTSDLSPTQPISWATDDSLELFIEYMVP